MKRLILFTLIWLTIVLIAAVFLSCSTPSVVSYELSSILNNDVEIPVKFLSIGEAVKYERILEKKTGVPIIRINNICIFKLIHLETTRKNGRAYLPVRYHEQIKTYIYDTL